MLQYEGRQAISPVRNGVAEWRGGEEGSDRHPSTHLTKAEEERATMTDIQNFQTFGTSLWPLTVVQ